jgi:hypothetical protein
VCGHAHPWARRNRRGSAERIRFAEVRKPQKRIKIKLENKLCLRDMGRKVLTY